MHKISKPPPKQYSSGNSTPKLGANGKPRRFPPYPTRSPLPGPLFLIALPRSPKPSSCGRWSNFGATAVTFDSSIQSEIPCWKLRINHLLNISRTAKNYSLDENFNFSEFLAVNGCIANLWLWCLDKLHRRLAKDKEPCGVARCISNRCV